MFESGPRASSPTEAENGDETSSKFGTSNAGPTAYHRGKSFISRDREEIRPGFKWHFYDNKGSYNGWFDWLPLWMRVGYWSPFVVLFLAYFYTSVFWYRPRPLEFVPSAIIDLDKEAPNYLLRMPKSAAFDLIVAAWGIAVIIYARLSLGSVVGLFMSFTGWSWALLTSRAGLDFAAWVAFSRNQGELATKLATAGSSLRFVVITNACVVCTLWNFIFFPLLYFVAMPRGEKRRNFLKFNFGFFMTNIHVLNLPLAAVNILHGSRARLFTLSDLWVSYLVVMLYSCLYLFVMDRVGLHFYPIFCPRTAFCILSFGTVLGLYYFLMFKWNDLISNGMNDTVSK